MQVWLIKESQSKYTDHCCSFMNNITKIVQKILTLSKELDVTIVHPKTIDNTYQSLLASNNSFQIKRERFIDNLRVLARFHPWFMISDRIDWSSLNSFPEHGFVFDRIWIIERIEARNICDQFGLNDANDSDPTLNITFDDFVPSFRSNEPEISDLQKGLQVTEPILTMPTIHPASINPNRRYIIEAFLNLFSKDQVDFHDYRSENIVSAQEYFKYLIRYRDDRFAQHSRFHYFAWNSLLCWNNKKRSRIFAKRLNSDDDNIIIDKNL